MHAMNSIVNTQLQNLSSMEFDETSMTRSSSSRLICRICGDVARGFNFDVITCMSCKSFFRRNAFRLSKTHRCQRKNYCYITKETRSGCSACRLKKCYAFGMNPLLIRSIDQCQIAPHIFQQFIITNRNQFQLPAPKPLNLLRNDCSNLTSDQWDLLSNIIHSYDEQNAINRVKHLLDEKSSLIPKLRLKSEDTLNIISQAVKDIVPLMEHSPHLQSLSSHARRALLLHNMFFVGGFNGLFVARETNAYSNMTYMTAINVLYGSDYMKKCARDNERLESNGNLIKLMLFVLIFSSNCSRVVFNDGEDMETMANSVELIRVQDIYVTMLWKYLVYLYGYNGAAMRFSLLVKNFTDMLFRAREAEKDRAHTIFVDRIKTKVERSLSIVDKI